VTRLGRQIRFARPALIAILVAACQTGGTISTASSPAGTATTDSSASTAPAVTARPAATTAPSLLSVTGDYQIGADGRTLRMTCLGAGSPTVLLEGGHPGSGLADFLRYGRAFTTLLAAERRVCAYDRAGYPSSDPAPNEPRDLDDVTDDLHALLEAAEIEGPLVLAGSSFGGFIVTYYAHRFPEGVEGVVLLDAPRPSATLTLEEAPELAWDSPTNPEHLDVVPEFENRLANERFPFEAPLLVITATEGGSTLAEHAFWLDWSAMSEHISIEGGHEVYIDSPEEVRDAILDIAP
jgi:pimeloyl-ACP methyl ester carboxylesterase